MKRFFFLHLIFSFLCSLGTQAQNNMLMGVVADKENGKALEGVSVKVLNSNIVTVTDKKGIYSIAIEPSKAIRLGFSLLGYQPLVQNIFSGKGGDTLSFNIRLEKKIVELPSVSISAVHKVDTVVGNWHFYIEDYEFYQDKYVLLTWEKNLSKSKVMLADQQQHILSSFSVPGEAINLYKDFLGNINVICKEAIYRLQINGNLLSLASLPIDQFNSKIKPCVDTLHENIYFSDYRDDYPKFDYYAYNKTTDSISRLSHIADEPLERLYYFEYEFLKPQEKLMARKLAQQYHMDKHDVAAAMTDFAHLYYFTPLYAPLFVINDTVCVFNHYKNTLYKYDFSNRIIDSVNFSYHHPKNWKEWKHQLVKDEQTNKVYALFQKDGFYFLKQIDLYTGKIVKTWKLRYQYVDRIKVKNDEVYYVYRPFDSLQKKFLYKESLSH